MAIILAGATVLAAPGCKNRGESAKQELKESGYEMTPESFFRAAESDDVTALEALVKGGMAPDTRNEAGDTALHAAAATGMLKSAEYLLAQKVSVNVLGAEGRTPLMAAVTKGSPAMVRYLLSKRADPTKKDAKGYRALTLAVHEGRGEMVGELAAYDRENLDTALLLASLEGKATVIDSLTSYGASVFARTDDGRTPLMLAAENGNIEAVEMLLGIGANRFAMDEQGRIAADMAREAGHEELAIRLSEEPAKEEFGIEEPVDLGAEMLAQMDEPAKAAEGKPAGEAGDAGKLPWNRPVAGQGGGAFGALPVKPVAVEELDGVVLEKAEVEAPPVAEGGAEPSAPSPLKMRAYRQKELPLRVESVQGETATIRLAGGSVQQVQKGSAIPGSSLTIVRMERRMRPEKDSAGGPTEASVVEVEDADTGHRRELVKGLASTAHDPVALVEDGGGHRYLARAGQKFKGADGTEYVVVDVRPNQMVIENLSKAEVITVPLRGPRG